MRGIGDLLYIDQYNMESKTRRKDTGMAWIYNKKAYGLVPQNWIRDCLKIYKIIDKFIKFIT